MMAAPQRNSGSDPVGTQTRLLQDVAITPANQLDIAGVGKVPGVPIAWIQSSNIRLINRDDSLETSRWQLRLVPGIHLSDTEAELRLYIDVYAGAVPMRVTQANFGIDPKHLVSVVSDWDGARVVVKRHDSDLFIVFRTEACTLAFIRLLKQLVPDKPYYIDTNELIDKDFKEAEAATVVKVYEPRDAFKQDAKAETVVKVYEPRDAFEQEAINSTPSQTTSLPWRRHTTPSAVVPPPVRASPSFAPSSRSSKRFEWPQLARASPPGSTAARSPGVLAGTDKKNQKQPARETVGGMGKFAYVRKK